MKTGSKEKKNFENFCTTRIVLPKGYAIALGKCPHKV